MRRSRPRLFLFTGLLFVLGARGLPQDEELVRIETLISRSGVHPGETFKIALRVRIEPGWHINGHRLADEFLIPTSFSFAESGGYKILGYFYPPAKSAKFEYSDTALSIYEQEVILGARVEAGPSVRPGRHKLSGTFTYQACDRRSCRPPKDIPLEVTFDVIPASQGAEDVQGEIFDKITFDKPKSE